MTASSISNGAPGAVSCACASATLITSLPPSSGRRRPIAFATGRRSCRALSSVSEVPLLAAVVATQHVLRDEDLVHLVRTVSDAQRARAEIHAGERQNGPCAG